MKEKVPSENEIIKYFQCANLTIRFVFTVVMGFTECDCAGSGDAKAECTFGRREWTPFGRNVLSSVQSSSPTFIMDYDRNRDHRKRHARGHRHCDCDLSFIESSVSNKSKRNKYDKKRKQTGIYHTHQIFVDLVNFLNSNSLKKCVIYYFHFSSHNVIMKNSLSTKIFAKSTLIIITFSTCTIITIV